MVEECNKLWSMVLDTKEALELIAHWRVVHYRCVNELAICQTRAHSMQNQHLRCWSLFSAVVVVLCLALTVLQWPAMLQPAGVPG